MDAWSTLLLIGMFTPGIIRGAYWYDSPSGMGVIWIFATIAAVVGVGWIASIILGKGIGPALIISIFIVYLNFYALKGSTFWHSKTTSIGGLDGDLEE